MKPGGGEGRRGVVGVGRMKPGGGGQARCGGSGTDEARGGEGRRGVAGVGRMKPGGGGQQTGCWVQAGGCWRRGGSSLAQHLTACQTVPQPMWAALATEPAPAASDRPQPCDPRARSRLPGPSAPTCLLGDCSAGVGVVAGQHDHADARPRAAGNGGGHAGAHCSQGRRRGGGWGGVDAGAESVLAKDMLAGPHVQLASPTGPRVLKPQAACPVHLSISRQPRAAS